MFVFDEYDEQFRMPLGAIATPGELRVRIKIQRRLNAQVEVVYRPDDEREETSISTCWVELSQSYDVFEGHIPLNKAALYWFYFRVKTVDSEFCVDGTGACDMAHAPFQVTAYDTKMHTPEWFKGGVMYHIFVDRFYQTGVNPTKPDVRIREDWGGQPEFQPDEEGIVRNNDFFGGNLAGVVSKLDYLADLGVTCIYLSPIFDAASNHKYDTGDYMKIDPMFGDLDGFKALCAKARQRGMRVILDGVFNHVGEDSRYFNRYGHYDSVGAYQSQDSPYYPWFHFSNWNEEYDCWWGVRLLPSVDKDDETYKQFITGEDGVARYWLKQGAGGWRLDVVDELPDSFLNPLCRAIKDEDEEALIIGEVWEDASNKISYDKRRRYLLGGQLDSVMNYPLKNAILEYIRNGNAEAVAHTMGWLQQNYPKPILDCLMNILGTHDTTRALTMLGSDTIPQTKEEMARFQLTHQQREKGITYLKLASLLQFTLPGVPCIYYGDEAGMEGCTDPFNRGCYPWGEEEMRLVSWYRKISDIRRRISAFKEGKYELICARHGVLVFRRFDEMGEVLVGINRSDREIPMMLPGPAYDYLTEKEVCELVLEPDGAMVIGRGQN